MNGNGIVQDFSGSTDAGSKDLRSQDLSRDDFFFQNLDPSTLMMVTLDGTEPSATNGRAILPYGTIEYTSPGWVPLGEVKVWCSLADKAYSFQLGG